MRLSVESSTPCSARIVSTAAMGPLPVKAAAVLASAISSAAKLAPPAGAVRPARLMGETGSALRVDLISKLCVPNATSAGASRFRLKKELRRGAAVIGMAGKDGKCAVYLLGQHGVHELVRPGLRSQRQKILGAFAQGGT